MKILNFSDAHLRDTRPRRRTDNYQETQIRKLQWIMNLANKEGAMVTCSGDLLDKPVLGESIKSWLISEFYPMKIYTVVGQHEELQRTFDEKCSLNLLSIVGTVTICYDEPVVMGNDICIYGSSWGEQIPEVYDPSHFNVLLIHKLISNKDYWNGYVPYNDAKAFLKEHKDYDIIFSGDNHKSFIVEYKDRYLVNCGSMMRSNIDQADHKPMCVIFDTDTRELTAHYIPVDPIEEVMDLESVREEIQINEKLNNFMEELRSINPYLSTSEDEQKFKRILSERIKTLPANVQRFVKEAM